MEKHCVAGFYIKLTSNAGAIPLLESELINFVLTFRRFKRDKALEFLFRLKYGTYESKKECLNWLVQKNANYILTANKVLNFSDEQLDLFVNELQIQYQAQDPLFLDIHSICGLPSGCDDELNALQEKMKNSPLLFFIAVKKCVKARKNQNVSQWIISLLSNNSASQTIALENLGFDFNYRICLKEFSKEIGTLLLAMREIYVKRQRLFNSQDTFALPLINLLKQIIELDIQANMLYCKNNSSQKYHHSDKVALFEADVLKFIENNRFNDFVEYRQKLDYLGKAIFSLLQAQIEYQKIFSGKENSDILFVAATDINLSKQMCSVQIMLKDAKTAYDFALNDYQKFLLEDFEAS